MEIQEEKPHRNPGCKRKGSRKCRRARHRKPDYEELVLFDDVVRRMYNRDEYDRAWIGFLSIFEMLAVLVLVRTDPSFLQVCNFNLACWLFNYVALRLLLFVKSCFVWLFLPNWRSTDRNTNEETCFVANTLSFFTVMPSLGFLLSLLLEKPPSSTVTLAQGSPILYDLRI